MRYLLCLVTLTALDRYVQKPDPSYRYEIAGTLPCPNGCAATVLDMTSQTWRKPDEVDRTVWKHWLTVVKPAKVTSRRSIGSTPKTVREQLERHRTPVVCASCHRVIDPPGFALEQFNSVGQWRTKGDNGAVIDSGGILADGSKVDGPVALRNAILARPEAFATVLTERLMTYALGRGIEPSDMPVIRAVVRKSALDNYRLAGIIQGIIDSAPFQMRTKLEPAGTSTTTVARATASASTEQP
jgi:hypothetical protein